MSAAEQSGQFHAHLLDREYLDRYRLAEQASRMPPNTARCARFFHLVQMLRLSRGAGDVTLEAGCFRGMASHLICQYRRLEDAQFSGAGHFLIDSFAGLSQPVEADGVYAMQRFEAAAFRGTSPQHVERSLAEFPQTHIIKGWIPDAFASLPEQRYRFVHIDVDLYEPTRDCLDYFYPRMSPGGVMVCDDFGPWPGKKWTGCSQALREFCSQQTVSFAALDTGNAVIIKR